MAAFTETTADKRLGNQRFLSAKILSAFLNPSTFTEAQGGCETLIWNGFSWFLSGVSTAVSVASSTGTAWTTGQTLDELSQPVHL